MQIKNSAIKLLMLVVITLPDFLLAKNTIEHKSSEFDPRLWRNVSEQKQSLEINKYTPNYSYELYHLNINSLSAQLQNYVSNKPQSRQQKQSDNGVLVRLPLLNGNRVEFILFESEVLPPGLSKKYPAIVTFYGYQKGNPKNTGRFDITSHGFHGMFNINNKRVFIDPIYNNQELYRVYDGAVAHTSANKPLPEQIFVYEHLDKNINDVIYEEKLANDFGTQLRTFRLAVSTSGEYTQFHGGEIVDGLSEVATAINRVNEVYERDLAISLMLVENNDLIIFTDPATDPFVNSSGDIHLNEAAINNAIGNDNYDIGHVFNTGGGGLAGLRVVCGTRKADGVTGIGNPINDAFYIDYVAHEIGHQFGGNHTFNGGAGSCGGGNRSSSNAFEPGSGTTIMAYAGICGSQNIQNNSDALFHSNSIDEIRSYITESNGASCGTLSSLDNNIPTVEAGNNRTIPMQTPFVLTGIATDDDEADNNNLSYTWEQMDLGSQTFSAADMIDNGSRPLFRSFLPSSNPSRTFPKMSTILNGTTSIQEVLPTTNRTMNFRLTVRDGRGGVSMDNTSVTVDNTTGPFIVTAPATRINADGARPITTEWDVANTNGGTVNCATVNISVSTDGGTTYEFMVAQEVLNNGNQEIILPNITTQNARIKVACSNDHFFNVSPINFTITETIGVPVIESQQTITTEEEQAVTISLDNLTVSDEDSDYPDDFTLNIEEGENYTLNGTEVIPNLDFNGDLSVNVTVSDDIWESVTFPFVISVTPVNDAPIISDAGISFSTQEDSALTLNLDDLVIIDVDNSVFTLEVSNGNNYSVNDNLISPDADFNGNLDISVLINDGELDSNSLILHVTVNAVNDSPIANTDTFNVIEDSQNNRFNTLVNDTDVDTGDQIMINSFVYVGAGNLGIAMDGQSLIYTPAGGFVGTESFTYSITDNDGAIANTNVNITVERKPRGGGSLHGLWLILLFVLAYRRSAIKNNQRAFKSESELIFSQIDF